MKKLLVVAMLVLFLMPFALPQVFATEDTAQTGIVDVGNKMCPVMGGPVSGQNFVVYEGKRYGLCCPMCEKTFLSDPAQYAAKADAAASAEMERDMEQGSL
ncbi:MAG: hypothetical protein ABH891_07865 [Candidatus Omnitrophota bacterium]